MSSTPVAGVDHGIGRVTQFEAVQVGVVVSTNCLLLLLLFFCARLMTSMCCYDTQAARDFAARYLSTVRRLDAANMNEIRVVVDNLLASPALRAQSTMYSMTNSTFIDVRSLLTLFHPC